jgi:hypothetical protein
MATSAVEEEMASAQKEGAVSGVVAGARDVEIRLEK